MRPQPWGHPCHAQDGMRGQLTVAQGGAGIQASGSAQVGEAGLSTLSGVVAERGQPQLERPALCVNHPDDGDQVGSGWKETPGAPPCSLSGTLRALSCPRSLTRANQPGPSSQGTAHHRGHQWLTLKAHRVPGTSARFQMLLPSHTAGKGRVHLCPQPPRVPPLVPSLSYVCPCLLLSKP